MMLANTPLFSVLVSLCLFAGANSANTDAEWDFKNQTAWNYLPGSSCGGTKQSPIDFNTSNVETSDEVSAIQLIDYSVAVQGELQNTGKNVQFSAPNSDPAKFVNHVGTYKFVQFHFHWGKDMQLGSDHFLDGKQFDGDLHFVHVKEGEPKEDGSDKFSVLGMFLEATDDPIEGSIWENLSPVPLGFKEKINITLKHSDFLPSDLSYYHYAGSLTTPLCDEAVQWFQLKTPIKVPESYLDMLRSAQVDEEGTEVLQENFRVIQELNGRTVYFYDANGGEATKATSFFAVALALFAAFFVAGGV